MSDDEIEGIHSSLSAQPGDMILIVADERRTVNHVLGLLRLEIGRPPVNSGELKYLWITEFPLFESVGDHGRPIPAHHPFTMPHLEDLEKLNSAQGEEYLEIRSQAYDLVLNGVGIRIRKCKIHTPEIQSKIFEILGIGEVEANEKFGFLLDAFRYGAPPHAGFVFGDRPVGGDSIREKKIYEKSLLFQRPNLGLIL